MRGVRVEAVSFLCVVIAVSLPCACGWEVAVSRVQARCGGGACAGSGVAAVSGVRQS